MDTSVRQIYQNRISVLFAILVKTLGLIIQTTEVWLACWLLGHPVGIVEAVMLKSLTATATDIAFLIPNGYGIQEGAFIIFGAILNIDPATALSLSLAIRLREIIIDIPGLLLWQYTEARKLLHEKEKFT